MFNAKKLPNFKFLKSNSIRLNQRFFSCFKKKKSNKPHGFMHKTVETRCIIYLFLREVKQQY